MFGRRPCARCRDVCLGAAARRYGPVSRVVNGGFTPTIGTTSDYLKSGWTLGVVVQPDSSSPFALQFDLAYSDFNATSKFIQLGQSQSFQTGGGRGDVWQVQRPASTRSQDLGRTVTVCWASAPIIATSN